MTIKKALFNIKGMTRDLAASKFSPEFAYENKNMRIIATDDNTSGILTNEKGNVKVPGINVAGIPIGQAVIDDELILFTTDRTSNPAKDYIYSLKFDSQNALQVATLSNKDLDFDASHPIETISVYESNSLKKVYWTDGKNQPRVINVAATSAQQTRWASIEDPFNFVRKLQLKEVITVTRNLVASGYFAPGVIQYCFTYFNLYGQESNIFYTSPQYYVSYNNRGADASDTVSNSFTIKVGSGTYDTNFDYIRVYSILRTSLDGVPQVRKVTDLALPTTGAITFTDTGVEGESIDPSELLYVGGEEIVAGTITQKDNTLFLGDILLKRKAISSTIKGYLANGSITFGNPPRFNVPAPSGIYPYENQLRHNSSTIKTFKYGEYYRFGIQFQHYTGKWSEPVWIKDAQIEAKPYLSSNQAFLPTAYYTLNNTNHNVIEAVASQGYVRVRPVVVFPKINERYVVCQGVLAPTVYNVGDRAGNAPFAQSSWFFRPNSYIDIATARGSNTYWEYPSGTAPVDSYRAQITNEYTACTVEGLNYTIDNFNRGRWAEFRHNYSLPQNNQENAEIQCLWGNSETPYTTTPDTYITQEKENFFVDQSIVTLHSPDIEFDTQVRSIDTSMLKLRIVGYVPLTASISDILIQSSTPVNNFVRQGAVDTKDIQYYTDFPMGEYKEVISTTNNSTFGWRSMLSGGFWFDELTAYKEKKKNPSKFSTGFVIYPWHRTGSYNNTKNVDSTGYRSAKTDKKKMSVLRFSYGTTYLNSVWTAYQSGSGRYTGVSDIAIFDSNEVSLVRLKAPANSGLGVINYYGNVDKLLTFTSVNTAAAPSGSNYPKSGGYPIIHTLIQNADTSAHALMSSNYSLPSTAHHISGATDIHMDDFTSQVTAYDPVSIKYKSTPHAVIALNYANGGAQRILPTTQSPIGQTGANSQDQRFHNNAFWDKGGVSLSISQDVLGVTPSYGYLWLGELYNDDETLVRFGGTTEEAFENNTWVPAGEAVSLYDSSDNLKSSVQVAWTEGDTYFQRYDCLKTYPFTLEDSNSVVDILSFMCETRVNLDGRYDRNRGQTSNLFMTPSIFNLLNPVYSQKNNFFNYRGVNSDKLSEDKFPNTITWTKTKTLGEEIDTWTNITLASTLDLDGNLGSVKALRRFKDDILAFQDNGISQVLYNENVQISATNGMPIEIANSGKVSGKRYISNKIGCINKWSICSTPNGLYFHDSINKDLYLFNGEFNNISDRLGFHSWVVSNLDNTKVWNSTDFDDVITYYDNINNDVLFITKNDCLAFSEALGQFSSFYDYGNTPFVSNIKDKIIMIHQNDSDQQSSAYYPYLHREGDYNKFFDVYKPFWTTVVVNPDATTDKIYNNLEFRSDSFDNQGILKSAHTFDHLNTWNEHQEGEVELTNTLDQPSTLKKKFRIWHAQIPRWNVNKNGITANGRDRMRNPWMYLKLSMENISNLNSNYRTVLHDLIVDYFE